MENWISIFDWEKPEVIPPNQFKQNPEMANWNSGKDIRKLWHRETLVITLRKGAR